MATSRKRAATSTAAPEGNASPYHHGDLRRALLDAAEALLARHGPAGVSLREAARAVGVSHNAPYRHFPDRAALLAALATEGFARLRAALEAAAAAAPEGRRVAATGRAYLDFARTHRGLYLLMFGPEVRIGAHPALAAAAAAALDVVRDAARADGAITAAETPSPPAATARHLVIGAWALVHGLAHLIADDRLAEDLAADGYAALIEDVLAAYGAGMRAAAPRQGH
mgnify:CR=1 FL=1